MEAVRDPALRTLLKMCQWLARNEAPILNAACALAGLSAAVILLRVYQSRRTVHRGRLYQIAVPQGTEVMPFAAEQLFAALHGLQEQWWRRLRYGLEHIALEIAADASGIRFFLWTPRRIAESVVRLVHSAYPEADIRPLRRDYLRGPAGDALGLPHRFPNVRRRKSALAGARLTLLRDIAFPIKTLREFEKTDPLAGITAAMTGLEEGEGIVVQLLLQPGGEWELRRRARVETARIERKRSFRQPAADGQRVMKVFRDYTPEEQQRVQALGGKRAKLPFHTTLRLLTVGPNPRQAYARLRGLAAAYGQFHVATLNGWQRRTIYFWKRLSFLRHVRARAFPLWGTKKVHRPLTGEHDVLTIEELSSLWHLPHPQVVETPGIIWSLSRKRAAARVPERGAKDGLVIARTSYRGESHEIVLPERALFTHVGVIGRPGAGKTTLLARLTLECMERGISVVLLDPHGDLCDKLLPRIPTHLREQLTYFNPAGDLDRPMGLNFLEPEPGQHPAQVKSEVVTMLMHLFGSEGIGPRSSYVLSNCIQTLQEIGGMTLLEVQRLLTDADFRARIVPRVRNRTVQEFWEGFFHLISTRGQRLYLDTISPVLNKIGAFATDPRVANVVGQSRSAFRLREILDSGRTLVCNLTQGGLGLDNSRLLGGAIASRVIQAAMAREDTPEEKRRPAVLIADEFHIYVGPAFPQALAQVRKYRLGLVLACQLLSQLEGIQGMRSAFLSAGTLCVFKLAAEDGSRLSAELTKFFDADDLVRMDPHQVAIRMSSDHEGIPFSGETIPLEESTEFDAGGVQAIRGLCRERHGRPVQEVVQEMQERSQLPDPASSEEIGLRTEDIVACAIEMEELEVDD